jgi:hypothetical protein
VIRKSLLCLVLGLLGFSIGAHAATITLSLTIGSQTYSSTPITLDDTSAQNILNTYTSVLNAGQPSGSPSLTPQQVLTSIATQLGGQAAQFTQQYLQNQATAAALASAPIISAPH